MSKHYEWTDMTLREICTVLIEHGIGFDAQRNMRPIDLCAAIEQVNNGELKSLAELEAERKQGKTQEGGRR